MLITPLLRMVGRLSNRTRLVPVNQFNHTSWIAPATSTDRLRSVRDRCLLDAFGGALLLVTFWMVYWYKGFCHMTKLGLFLFLFVAFVA